MSTQRESAGSFDGMQPIQGAIYGGLAFVAGYVLTFVLLTVDSEANLDGEEGLFELVGMIFYNAQYVDTELSYPGETESINVLSENSTQIPELGYTLVPVCLLIGAGYLVARGASDATTTAESAAKTGVSIVAGYLPLIFLGTILFEETDDFFGESISIGPETGSAILIAGLLFPIVLGAIGGYLSQR
ncbi:hypothetical protein [Natronorubrum sp. FCH18a]|uniref:hypothetical protein n=1 Tax=Natronorubrum sp. FCH18a TaxID=3447018 RepID=UPI003F513529